jgi:hypothetical protein
VKSLESANTTRLPSWAVALIAFVLFTYLGVYICGVKIIFVAKDILDQAVDPNRIRQIAHDIAKLPDPLPESYQYRLGLDLGPLELVTIEHEPDKQKILLVSEVGLDDLGDSAALAIRHIYDNGVNIPTNVSTVSAHFVSQKSQGQLEIAGKQMCYIIGELRDSENKKLEGMVGCIEADRPKVKRYIIIYALEPSGQPYSLEITLKLLNSISGF